MPVPRDDDFVAGKMPDFVRADTLAELIEKSRNFKDFEIRLGSLCRTR
jgi:hypothetical protein